MPIHDPVLEEIVSHLVRQHRCHTVLLYGSRARGEGTATSDYDVLGIRKRGAMLRIAKKKNGAYWDVFVYPEKDLQKLNEQHLSWLNARVLVEQNGSGKNLITRVQALARKPFKPLPKFELDVLKAWVKKQLERIEAGDVHGLYRRSELQWAAVEHYFQLRRRRFLGPKAGLNWIAKHDPTTYRLFARAYQKPADKRAMRELVKRVYRIQLS